MRPVFDLTFELAAFAGAAGPVLAAIGHADALADGRRQYRLAGIDRECAAAGLHGNLEGARHGLGGGHL